LHLLHAKGALSFSLRASGVHPNLNTQCSHGVFG
jgi:hypothetical protein